MIVKRSLACSRAQSHDSLVYGIYRGFMQYYLYIQRCCGYQCVFISHFFVFLSPSLFRCVCKCVYLSRFRSLFSLAPRLFFHFIFCFFFALLFALIVCTCFFSLHSQSILLAWERSASCVLYTFAHTPCCFSKSIWPRSVWCLCMNCVRTRTYLFLSLRVCWALRVCGI